jgi:hypothetical protein
VHHRIGPGTLCTLLLSLVAALCSGCNRGPTTASHQTTPTPTTAASTRAEAAQIASGVDLPATFTPETHIDGSQVPCVGRCWRSVDTPREALASLTAAMRSTGLAVTAACVAPTSMTGQPVPHGEGGDACTAKGASKSWVISLSAVPGVRHGTITATGSTVFLAVEPAGARYVLKACQQGQPCQTLTSSPGT